MKRILKDNIVYFTIVNKKMIKLDNVESSYGKLETIQSKVVLKKLLDYFGIEYVPIIKTELGKPYFKDQDVFFNYSHSKNYIACAIAKCNVGVDIEENDRIINDTMIKKAGFTKENKLEEFVQRESICKLTGKGVAIFFDKKNFKNLEDYNKTIITNDYICSVCAELSNLEFKFLDIKKL